MTPMPLPFGVTLREVSGIKLEVAEAGPQGGPLIILLHGFPDLWPTWHSPMAMFAELGFRVLAPNQRGYGRSDKPRGIPAYDIDHLANDVVNLAISEGCQTFDLVGHDWGGVVAFWTAAKFPNRVKHLAVLNAPHPGVFKSYLLSHPSQLLRSWYVGFFQFPFLPETVLRAANFAVLSRSLQRTSRPGTFDLSDRDYLHHGWKETGALTAMLNYYRAIMRRSEESLRLRVTVPVKLIFGTDDPTEERGLADASSALCDHVDLVWFEQSRHWPHREEENRTNQTLADFFAAACEGGDRML